MNDLCNQLRALVEQFDPVRVRRIASDIEDGIGKMARDREFETDPSGLMRDYAQVLDGVVLMLGALGSDFLETLVRRSDVRGETAMKAAEEVAQAVADQTEWDSYDVSGITRSVANGSRQAARIQQAASKEDPIEIADAVQGLISDCLAPIASHLDAFSSDAGNTAYALYKALGDLDDELGKAVEQSRTSQRIAAPPIPGVRSTLSRWLAKSVQANVARDLDRALAEVGGDPAMAAAISVYVLEKAGATKLARLLNDAAHQEYDL